MKYIFTVRPALLVTLMLLPGLGLWQSAFATGQKPVGEPCGKSFDAPCPQGLVCKDGSCRKIGLNGLWLRPVQPALLDILRPGRRQQTDGALLTASRSELAGLLDCANLVGRARQRLLAQYPDQHQPVVNGITIDETDFEGFMAPDRDILELGQVSSSMVTMDIGQADLTTAQTWTLPAALTSSFVVMSRSACVSPASIPAPARDPATTHAIRIILNNRKSYYCFGVADNEVSYLGIGDDNNDPNAADTFFDSGSALTDTWSDVPLNLGDSWTADYAIDLEDDPAATSAGEYEVEEHVVNYDGFGTLNTPFGIYQALRQTSTITTKRYPNATATAPSQVETERTVLWATKEGLMVQARIVGNALSGTVQLSHFQALRSVPSGSLPVTLKNFTARKVLNRSVLLDWQTASEQNAKEFQIGRSLNLWQFDPVGAVPATGNTNTTQTYSLTDETPLPGTSYYRLRQVDSDGKYQDFKPVAVTLDQATGLLFPNPSDGRSVRVRAPESVPMQLHSTEGRALPFSRRAVEAGVQEVTPASVLKAGVYLLTVGNETFKWVVR
jgi:hypothetical protein